MTMQMRCGRATVDLVQGDITRVAADAIVNAANSGLRGGGGVDGAIHAAAGPAVMAELRDRYHGCPTGGAVSTGAGRLRARIIVHAVGPVWRGGSEGEAALLGSAYATSLDRAAEAGAASVAFPAISTGIYGYPLDEAAPVALSAIRGWLETHAEASVERVTFVLRSSEAVAAFEDAMALDETVARRAARMAETDVNQPIEQFDFVILGSGAAGESALDTARERGATAAIVDDDLFGGSCAYWACMPSKALLHAAAVHHGGGDFPWAKASDFRDWMINREDIDYPDDSSHEAGYRRIGGAPIRGRARIAGPGRVDVTAKDGTVRQLAAHFIVIAVGSTSRIPPMDGLDRIRYWTNRDGTSTRILPRSLLIMGGGPTGVELAQVYLRYGVPVTIIDSNDRIISRDHPRNSAALTEALAREGAVVRTGVRAVRIAEGAGPDGAHRVELSDGSTVEGHEVLVAIGRAFPLDGLGLETVGVSIEHGLKPDASLRVAENVFVVGDPAGPELHTHLAHYEGDMAIRIALGDDVRPDLRAIPRATYTDPETASVGLRLEEAQAAGHDAFERTIDLGATAKGYVTQSSGHVTLVVDRPTETLLGAFIAGPGASETIHEAVLALKLRVPLRVLADTIHAFPTTARVMGTLFIQVARELEGGT